MTWDHIRTYSPLVQIEEKQFPYLPRPYFVLHPSVQPMKEKNALF